MKNTLPDARDFNTIETLRDKYITNWNSIPKQLQDFILTCDKYFMYNTQSITLYHGRTIVAEMGVTRWHSDTEVNSIGAGDLFQWNTREGFTSNNLI